MTTTASARSSEVRPRPALGARRFGYVVAVLLDAVLLRAVNVWPGWQRLPFLTPDASLVLGVLNASVVVGLVANVVYLVRDPRWLKALGDAVTTAVGLLVLVRLWDVFPFDFGDTWVSWAVVARCALALGIVGSCIAVAVNLVVLARELTGRPR